MKELPRDMSKDMLKDMIKGLVKGNRHKLADIKLADPGAVSYTHLTYEPIITVRTMNGKGYAEKFSCFSLYLYV